MGKPVVDGGTDLTALDRWFAGPVMARDQQQDAVAAPDCLIEAAVDRRPGAVEG